MNCPSRLMNIADYVHNMLTFGKNADGTFIWHSTESEWTLIRTKASLLVTRIEDGGKTYS